MGNSYFIDFRIPETSEELAEYVGIGKALFEQVITSNDRKEFYKQHLIPKCGGTFPIKYREVWEAPEHLASGHKALARRFELFARQMDSQFPHQAAYGYVRSRGTRDNALVHCGAPLLLRADLRNFFPSISIERLVNTFVKLGMKPRAAVALARFATIEDRLPLGLNTSPLLANLVCMNLDQKLQLLASTYGCKYTRYADDISISGEMNLPSRDELELIVAGEDFALSKEKFRITKNGQAHYVTGLSVSDPQAPHAPKKMKRRLRQELYFCKKFGIISHLHRASDITTQMGINRLDGTVRYVGYHEPIRRSNLVSQWDALLKREDLLPSYKADEDRAIQTIACFVDETEFSVGKQNYLALGLVFTDDVAAIRSSTSSALRDHQVDPFASGDKEALTARGLHFADSHPDLRTKYIQTLSGLPYRAFVIFTKLENHDDYEQRYLALLSAILPKRLVRYDRALLTFVFEENSKIDPAAVERTVKEIYSDLENTNSQRPAVCPIVTIGTKMSEICFAAPDYLLAVFQRFASLQEKNEEVRQKQFERLRDKYRLIIDMDRRIEFSRRRPFEPLDLPANSQTAVSPSV